MSTNRSAETFGVRSPDGGPPPPISRLHPDLLELMHRTDLIPDGDLTTLPETTIAQSALLALSLADDAEQAHLVSRIMTPHELALQRLQRPDVQNLSRNILFTPDERRAALTRSPEPSVAAGPGPEPCIVCTRPGTVRLPPCRHPWCPPCLRECVRRGLRSELAFPPRCCAGAPLDEDAVARAQRPALVHLLRQVSHEFRTPPAERLYCHDARCGVFIPGAGPARERAVRCAVCGRGTCGACGAAAHLEGRCERGEGEEEAWRMMDANGLVGCPRCGLVMGLKDGCNHMTCLCGAEFCYICGENRSARCDCPQFNGRHLRVPVRHRPGRLPATRGQAAKSARQEDEMLAIPQLRDDYGPVNGAQPNRAWVYDQAYRPAEERAHPPPQRPGSPALVTGGNRGGPQSSHPRGDDEPRGRVAREVPGVRDDVVVDDGRRGSGVGIPVLPNGEEVSGVLDQEGEAILALQQALNAMEILDTEETGGRHDHTSRRRNGRHRDRHRRHRGHRHRHDDRDRYPADRRLLALEREYSRLARDYGRRYARDWLGEGYEDAEDALCEIADANAPTRQTARMLHEALDENPLVYYALPEFDAEFPFLFGRGRLH